MRYKPVCIRFHTILNNTAQKTRFHNPYRRTFYSMSSNYEHLLIRPTTDGLQKASALINSGQLVAFPTETVYGLGANALNAQAVTDIFKAKGRPMTDPLIVHILGIPDAERLADMDFTTQRMFRILSNAFWPGELTVPLCAE